MGSAGTLTHRFSLVSKTVSYYSFYQASKFLRDKQPPCNDFTLPEAVTAEERRILLSLWRMSLSKLA